MTSKHLLQFGLGALLIFLVAFAIYLSFDRDSPFDSFAKSDGAGDALNKRTARDPIVSPRTDGQLDPSGREVVSGGVERPASDLPQEKDEVPEEGAFVDVGTTPAIPPDANEQVALVVEAVTTGRHPERLSPTIVSKTPFDREAYQSDPEMRASYLRTPEPGRVFTPAQPAPGTPRIRLACNPYAQINQGESIVLRVQGVPGMPVTFTSFDLGEFENRLTTITVEADESGFAHAPFTAPPGTFGPVRIMAASPVTSGQVRLTVNVAVPEQDS